MTLKTGLFRTRMGAAGLAARLAGLILLSLAITGSSCCAEERDPINRVQTNALPKAFFDVSDYYGVHDSHGASRVFIAHHNGEWLHLPVLPGA